MPSTIIIVCVVLECSKDFNCYNTMKCLRELMSWVNDMKALLSADELAKDMSGAEAMLQRHRERKGEIDAQEDSFKTATQFGQSLISSGHFASEQLKKEVGCKAVKIMMSILRDLC